MSQVVTLVNLDTIEAPGSLTLSNHAPAALSNELPEIPDVLRSVEPPAHPLPKGRSIIVIAALAGVSFLNCISLGFLTVGLPRTAVDVKLPEHLLLW